MRTVTEIKNLAQLQLKGLIKGNWSQYDALLEQKNDLFQFIESVITRNSDRMNFNLESKLSIQSNAFLFENTIQSKIASCLLSLLSDGDLTSMSCV